MVFRKVRHSWIRMLFVSILMLFLGWNSVLLHAQTPIDPQNVNKKLLEHHIKRLVDSVRIAHKLYPLSNDEIAYKAADLHARYLKPQNRLTHDEVKPKLRRPQDRVVHFGGLNYLAGENIVRVSLTDSYESTAKRMVISWVKSPGHYANMITPDYTVTGLAIALHPKTGQYIAVQVFAKIPYKYEFEENPKVFPYSKTPLIKREKPDFINNTIYTGKRERIPYGLKSYSKHKTAHCKKCSLIDQASLRRGYEGIRSSLYSYGPEVLRSLFKRRRDGIVFEYVNFEPYHCDNPNYTKYPLRRNGNSSTSGFITKPYYRKKILEDLKLQKIRFKKERRTAIKILKKKQGEEVEEELEEWKKKKFEGVETVLATDEMPTDIMAKYVTSNVLLIHKGRIHYPLYFTNYCSDPDLQEPVEFVYKNTDFPIKLTIPDQVRTFLFRNYYHRGETNITDSVFRVIEDTLQGWTIDSMYIHSFSSIEGTEELNQKYHQQRAENVAKALKNHYDTLPKLRLETDENWAMFDAQVGSTKTRFLSKFSHEKIKERMTQEKYLNYWDSRLDQERYSEISIHAHRRNGIDTLNTILSELKKTGWYDKDNPRIVRRKSDSRKSRKPVKPYKNKDKSTSGSKIDAGDETKVFHQYLKEHAPEEFLKIHYPMDRAFEEVLYDQLNVALKTLDTSNPFEVFNMIDRLKEFDSEFRSDLAFINAELIKIQTKDSKKLKWNFNSKSLKRITQMTKEGNYQKEATELKLKYYLTYLHTLRYKKHKKKIDKGVDFVFNYYRKHLKEHLDDPAKVRNVVDFFIHHMREQYAFEIINMYFSAGKYDTYIYQQFLKMGFLHPTHTGNRSWVKSLIAARNQLTDEQWCDLFMGPCGINFEVFDDAELRDLYCETCGSDHYKTRWNKP